MAVQILKATSAARIVAVDTREDALALATSCGADVTVVSGPDAAAAIRAASGRRGSDVVLDFVGSDATLALAAAVARPLGDITIVGIAGGTLPVSFFSLPYEVSIQTTYWGFRSELIEMLDLAARGLVKPAVTTFALDDAMDAYRAMETGKFQGRLVVDPNRS
jgi:propanol-preferring alcohol dehydrogenase